MDKQLTDSIPVQGVGARWHTVRVTRQERIAHDIAQARRGLANAKAWGDSGAFAYWQGRLAIVEAEADA